MQESADGNCMLHALTAKTKSAKMKRGEMHRSCY